MRHSTFSSLSRSPIAARAALGLAVAVVAANPMRAQGDQGAVQAAAQAAAQATAQAAARIRQVLPADVANRILAQIAAARSRGLPEAPLEQRVLKFAAKGVRPALIESSLTEHVARMSASADALHAVRGAKVAPDEIEAGAEAIRKGVSGADVRSLATSAPSGRSLAVPLYVVSTLIDRGLPADDALARVRDRLRARANDADLERLPDDLAAQGGNGVAGRADQGDGRADQGSGRGNNVGGGKGKGGGPPTTRPGGGPPGGVPATGGHVGKPGKGRGHP